MDPSKVPLSVFELRACYSTRSETTWPWQSARKLPVEKGFEQNTRPWLNFISTKQPLIQILRWSAGWMFSQESINWVGVCLGGFIRAEHPISPKQGRGKKTPLTNSPASLEPILMGPEGSTIIDVFWNPSHFRLQNIFQKSFLPVRTVFWA